MPRSTAELRQWGSTERKNLGGIFGLGGRGRRERCMQCGAYSTPGRRTYFQQDAFELFGLVAVTHNVVDATHEPFPARHGSPQARASTDQH